MLVQIHAEIPWKLHDGKSAGNASPQSGSPISRSVHVPAYDDGFTRLDIYRPARSSERLFADMAVEEHPPIDEPSVGRHHFPPIGILAAPGVGTPNRNREPVRTRVAADGGLYRIRVVP